MKILLSLLFAGLISPTVHGQEKKDLTISFGAGLFTSPYYKNSDASGFYAVDFDYNINSRHVIAANFNAGGHNYQDNVRSNVPAGENLINSKAVYRTFSVLYKYQFIEWKSLSIYGGTGAGMMTQILEFPYNETNSQNYRHVSWSDLVFPVRLDINYHLSKRTSIGILGGFFIHPDFPILGYHSGLKILYKLK